MRHARLLGRGSDTVVVPSRDSTASRDTKPWVRKDQSVGRIEEDDFGRDLERDYDLARMSAHTAIAEFVRLLPSPTTSAWLETVARHPQGTCDASSDGTR